MLSRCILINTSAIDKYSTIKMHDKCVARLPQFKAHAELARVPIFILYFIFLFFIFIYGFKFLTFYWILNMSQKWTESFRIHRVVRTATKIDNGRCRGKKKKSANRTGWIFCSLCARVRTIGRSWGPRGHGLAHGAPWGPQREVSVLSFVLIMRPDHRRLYIKENNHCNRA